MTEPNQLIEAQSSEIDYPKRSLPVKQLPPSTTGGDGFATVFYMGVMGLFPTVVMGMAYNFYPLMALIVLPFATFKACRLATARYAAYEDTSPAHAAFVQSALVWLCLLLSVPVALAFNTSPTVIPQLLGGGFLAALGPGVAATWADLPRQIYFPVQQCPTPPHQTPERVIAGTKISSFQTVAEEQLDYMLGKIDGEIGHDDDVFTDEDYERF